MNQLIYQHKAVRAIRNFFDGDNFCEIFPPPMVENPGMETHIHPFEIYSANNKKSKNLFLNTSPEFKLKQVLAESDIENIYSIAYSFRDEPKSQIHRPQFLMLEWYRKNEHYQKIMQDCENLLTHIQSTCETKLKINSYERVTIQDIFQDKLQIDILNFLNAKELKDKIEKDFKDVPLPSTKCSWDDYFFLLFLNKIEPDLKNYPYLLLYEFPAPLSALSTLKPSDPRVCERFEIYLNGVELCNCFNELTDYEEQVRRFKAQAEEKKIIYGYELPWPKEFLSILKNGYPKSAGIALGVERLVSTLFEIENPFFE